MKYRCTTEQGSNGKWGCDCNPILSSSANITDGRNKEFYDLSLKNVT